MRYTTPLVIEIAMHYYVSNAPFDPERINAPAVVEVHQDLERRKLITKFTDGHYERNYEALDIYFNALCSIPLPQQEWVIPQEKIETWEYKGSFKLQDLQRDTP